MKKTILMFVFTIVAAMSWSQDKDIKNSEVDICDCVKAQKEMGAKLENADGDANKIKAIEEEYKADREACKAFGARMKNEIEALPDDEGAKKKAELMAMMEACDGDINTEPISKRVKEITICDCVKGQKEMSEKIKEAGDDADMIRAIKDEYKEDKEACEELGEEIRKEMQGLSDKEKEEKEAEFMAQFEACDNNNNIELINKRAEELTLCDCVDVQEDMFEKIKEADDDSEKLSAIEEEFEIDMQACTKQANMRQKEIDGLTGRKKEKQRDKVIASVDACREYYRTVSKREQELEICDCVKAMEMMKKELEEAGDDEKKIARIKDKHKLDKNACEKKINIMRDIMLDEMQGLSDKEKKAKGEEMMKELEACK